MPNDESPARKRVRTGCLTCRRRKRKCDETRPNCENCRSKSLVCRYGVNFTFVAPKQYGPTWSSALVSSNTSSTSNTLETSVYPYNDTAAEFIPNSHLSYNTHGLTSQWTQSRAIPHTSDHIHASTDQTSSTDEINAENEVGIEQTIDWDVTGVNSGTHDTVQQLEHTSSIEQELQPALCQPLENEERPSTPLGQGADRTRKEHELALLHHYRYNVATMLDLGLGHSYYGIHVMMHARKSLSIHNAILAVSSCHWKTLNSINRLVNEAPSTMNTIDTHNEVCPPTHRETQTRLALAATSILIDRPPQIWIEGLHSIVSQAAEPAIIDETRPLLARLILAASIMASSRGKSELIAWFLDDTLSVFSGIGAEHPQHELQESLILLAESCRLLPDLSYYGKQRLQAWQSCWEKLGQWYHDRTVQMREILQLPDTTGFQSRDERVFPFILFSSGCATVANVAYHLAALQLLRNKPRLLKPSARPGSPTSSLVHAQRLIGIVGAAVETEIWDPLVGVAVLIAARGLSHHRQREVAVQILRKMIQISGMKFGDLADELMPCEARSGPQTHGVIT